MPIVTLEEAARIVANDPVWIQGCVRALQICDELDEARAITPQSLSKNVRPTLRVALRPKAKPAKKKAATRC